MDNAFARKLLIERALTPDEIALYREQTTLFRQKFGREMGPESVAAYQQLKSIYLTG